MNKMGVWQRSWCILVTFALLVALSFIYTKAGREADRESVFPAVQPEATAASILHTASAALAYDSGGHRPRIKLIRATVFPHQSPEFDTASERSEVLKYRAKIPAPGNKSSIPVAAPAPEQIIRTFKVTATGYTAGFESTGKRPNHPEYGITYSGVKVRRDKNAVSTIAADPKVLPLGSILYVPGYGYAVVADTGSAIKGHKVDLYFATTRQVYKEWGKRMVEVQLIKRGSGKCTEAMLKNIGRAIRAYDTVPQEMLEEII
nr:3D domain-containing protein [Paenibacillus rhizophilus]